jgi:hypothetical protein
MSARLVLQGEANPIFLLTKSLLLVLALKLFVLGALGYYVINNKYNTHFTYYLTLIIIVITIGAVGIAAGGNIYALFHPAVLAAVIEMNNADKVQGYASYMMIVYLLPLLLSLLSFKLYEWSVKKAEFKKNE